MARIAAGPGKPRGLPGVAAAAFAAVSVAGILNVLPQQDDIYRSHSNETGIVGFLRDQDRSLRRTDILPRRLGSPA